MSKCSTPIPIFDTAKYIGEQKLPLDIADRLYTKKDFDVMREFLIQYQGSQDTFNAYRRELERLTQWAWLVANKSILDLGHKDIEKFIEFCQSPPASWVGLKKTARFIDKSGERLPNPDWRLFVVTIKKSAVKQGMRPKKENYELSQKALQALFSSLSSFYNYLMRGDLKENNPIAQIRQKSRFLRKKQGKRQIRRLTTAQWDHVIKTAKSLAEKDPSRHERTLFIMTILYLLYLRVSELAASYRWEPKMGDFYQDSQGRWWFKTVGKGNKERDISVGDSMLDALKRYRESRNLTPTLPAPGETEPLIHKLIGKGPVSSTREIRYVVQNCFDAAIASLMNDNLEDDAIALTEATVHWLRHTGISDDINKFGRPISHVRDDAGHSSSATTDLYNDSELQARHASARKKVLDNS
ncbi:MAG: tyrosine-type recombinase/integrase [Gammaproteobacteria bacterium]|nr:tyrosine-type recombinase/integrase [Gammaproteobacteria bacterium]